MTEPQHDHEPCVKVCARQTRRFDSPAASSVQFSGDQGTDPILPGFPPVNYMMKVWDDGTQPRVTWTEPDYFAIITAANETEDVLLITLTSYDFPVWAIGTPYILNSGVTHSGVRYRSLQNNNTGHTPGDGGDPGWWAVDTTLFKLWRRNGLVPGSPFVLAYDSTAVGSPGEVNKFVDNPPRFYPESTTLGLPENQPFPYNAEFYVEAVSGGVSIYSITVGRSGLAYLS